MTADDTPGPFADLHVHTTASDGALSLDAVPAAARRAGVGAVAITDHDRIHPDLDTPVTTVDGIELLRGIELRVEVDTDFRVDLLGYGVDPTTELADLLTHLQRDRIERARAIVARVEDRLGVELAVEFRQGIGRPHIARAIDAHPDAPYDYTDAFTHLIGDDGPCYVSRDVPSFERGRTALAGACGLVGLAHPFRYADPDAALALTADLDAVERWYPYERPVDMSSVERAIAAYDLVPTGGSDAHDDRLGRAGLSRRRYRRFRDSWSR